MSKTEQKKLDHGQLFDELPEAAEAGTGGRAQALSAEPRVHEPNRRQLELRALDLESLLPAEHRARLVWAYVERQDLSSLLAGIKARGSAPGRRATDPRVLFALWLYATLDGVGSGRELARLTQEHHAYRWICGGVPVNYHLLNDFRSGQADLMDKLLTNNVAALASAGLVRLVRVAQDGMRVRASAGAASFKRQGTLREQLAKAGELVRTLREEASSDPAGASRRARAAQERAAREREQRLQQALARLPELEQAKRRNGANPDEARASTSDAQASVMKMADGGWRPAYNVQLATDCASQVIVGVDAVSTGSDMAQLAPMVAQVEQRLGRAPEQWLVDGGFPAHAQIQAVAHKTEVYAPVPEPRRAKAKPAAHGQRDDEPPEPPSPASGRYEPKADDSPAVAQWRQRMGTDAAREIYKDRAATAECVNAQARNRGLLRLPVRGLQRVLGVVRLFALAHNLMRMAQLAPRLIGWA